MKSYHQLSFLLGIFRGEYFDYIESNFCSFPYEPINTSKFIRNAEKAKLIKVKETLKRYQNVKYQANENIMIRNYKHHGYCKRR